LGVFESWSDGLVYILPLWAGSYTCAEHYC